MNFRLATPADDTRLRTLARTTVVPGHIRVIYAREPNFFAGVSTAGGTTQVIIAEDGDRIVGQGCRTVRDLYVNGKPTPVGYLSGLRLAPEARNRSVLARGYAFLKQLHDDGETAGYLSTIVAGNELAQTVLTSRRAGLPMYAPMGTYLTHVFPARSRPPKPRHRGTTRIVTAAEVPSDQVRTFLRHEGSRRQFFPVCPPGPRPLPAAIGAENLLVALKDNRVVGTMGVWDRNASRQCIVEGYSPLLRTLRPCLNGLLRLRGCHGLPPPGAQIRLATAALVRVKDDNPDVLRSLLDAALATASARGLHQFALGLHERDPLTDRVKSVFHITYRSLLYVVSWDNGAFYGSVNPDPIPYLELGAL